MFREKFTDFCVLALFIVAAFTLSFTSVRADETLNKNYGTGGSNTTINQYSRLGSHISITDSATMSSINLCDPTQFPELVCTGFTPGTATANAVCNGGGIDGGWSATVSGECWQNVQVCYEDSGVCQDIAGPAQTNDVTFTPSTTCSSTGVKGHCTHDYNGVIGVLSSPNDDMFRIEKDANAFFEYSSAYSDISSPDRLKWFDRSDLTEIRDMVLPSRPSDYENFASNSPPSVNVEGACYPVNIKLCENVTAVTPTFDGLCGVASSAPTGTYTNLASIPNDDFCHVGEPITVSETASHITWTCDDYNGGNDSAQCSYAKSNDAVCGADNGEEFDNLAELQASGQLCASGTPTAISGSGPFYWSCQAGSGGNDASCAAIETNQCDSFFINDNMVFVQDVSGSFSDDIGNITTALDTLFDNPVFEDWDVGITRFNNGSVGDYMKALNFKKIKNHKSQIVSETNQHASYIDTSSENAWHAIVKTIDDFKGHVPSGEQMTIVLVTDEWQNGYHGGSYWQDDARNAIVNNDVRFLALTNNQWGASDGFIPFAASVGGKQVEITTNSSNFQDALLEGLVEVNCSP